MRLNDTRWLWLFLGLLATYLFFRAWRWEEWAVVVCAVLLLPPLTRRFAAAGALVFYIARFIRVPAAAANHEFLEAAVVLLLALVPTARDEAARAAFRRTIVAIVAAVVLISGLQKVAHGYYTSGLYFSVEYAQPSKFSRFLQKFVAEEDRVEVADFHKAFLATRTAAIPGPLERPLPRPRLVAAASVAMCWLTLAAEIVLPILLFPRRTRFVAAILLLAFFAGVEVVAKEYMFGALFAILLTSCLPAPPPPDPAQPPPAPGPWTRRACEAVLALFVVWPPAHLALVHATDLWPWKMGGFGMYSVPGRWGVLRVEVRYPGETRWKGRPPRSESERDRYEHKGYLIRNAPFLLDTVRQAAVEFGGLAEPGTPGAPAVVRVRSLFMRHDLATDRFHLEERVYLFP